MDLHDDIMVLTNNLMVGLEKYQHQHRIVKSSLQDTVSQEMNNGYTNRQGLGEPEFRDPSTAPLHKMTVDLIKTYKHINEVSIVF